MASQSDSSGWRSFAEYLGLATMLPAAVLVGALLGDLLDRHIHTWPLFTIVFILFGAVAGVLEAVRVVKRNIKRDEQG